MQINKMKTALAGLAMIGLIFTSCSGEDGDAGPAGPTGNANVMSMTYTVADSNWSGGNATISVPELSKTIADNGNVAVYYTTDSLTNDTITWNAMPYRFVGNVGGTNTFITLSYSYEIGEIAISSRASNNAPINFSFDSYYKVVLIPSSSKLEGVNLNNYEEVKAVYGIKEQDFAF